MLDHRESRSVGESLQLIFRHAPVIMLVGLVSGLAAFLLAPAGGAVEVRAEATLGLTDEVDFPFYEQTRDQFAARAEADGLAERIMSEFGGTVTELTAEPSLEDTTRTAIVAAGSNERDVLAAADQLAAELVELSRSEREGQLVIERDLLLADQELLNAEIATLSDEFAAAAAREAAARVITDQANPATFEEDLAALRQAELERDSARNRMGTLERAAEDLTDDLLAIERDIAQLDGDLLVVGEAAGILAAPDDRTTVGVLGMLAGVVLSTLVVTTFLGGRTNVRRSVIEDRFPSTPVYDGDGHQPIAPINADVWGSRIDRSSSVGVLRTETAADFEADWMKSTELDGVVGTPEAFTTLSNAAEVILICTEADRLSTIESIVQTAATFDCPTVMIVIDAG